MVDDTGARQAPKKEDSVTSCFEASDSCAGTATPSNKRCEGGRCVAQWLKEQVDEEVRHG